MGVTIPLLVGVLAGAEAILLLIVSMPASRPIRSAVNGIAVKIIQPLLFSVPLALVLLLDVYEKFNSIADCRGEICTAADRDRYKKQEMKTQRNLLLSLSVLFLYWLLWRVTMLNRYILHLEARPPPAKKVE